MTDADRAPGFYWISMDSLPPEVARWDAEAQGWLLIGAADVVLPTDPAEIEELAGPLSQPAVLGRSSRRARVEGVK